jgi:hypothetical protein
MTKETSRTNHGNNVVTETTTYTKPDGSGKSYSHTFKEGFVFDDTISRSQKEFGPKK